MPYTIHLTIQAVGGGAITQPLIADSGGDAIEIPDAKIENAAQWAHEKLYPDDVRTPNAQKDAVNIARVAGQQLSGWYATHARRAIAAEGLEP